MYDSETTTDVFTLHYKSTSGQKFKINKQRCKLDMRKHFFTNRIVDTWNSLPEHIVTCSTTTSLKFFI